MAPSIFDPLTDAELDRMTTRAWREAARCWSEFHNEPIRDSTITIRPILHQAARDADAWWATLRDEQQSRRVWQVPPVLPLRLPPCPECGGPADTGAGHDCEV